MLILIKSNRINRCLFYLTTRATNQTTKSKYAIKSLSSLSSLAKRNGHQQPVGASLIERRGCGCVVGRSKLTLRQLATSGALQRPDDAAKSSTALSSSDKLPSVAKVVICGGGLIGTSVAYHLAELGYKDVVLVTRDR